MDKSFVASFGTSKGGLANVQTAFFDDDNNIIGIWIQNATEMVAGSGIYWAFLTIPVDAARLAWKTGDGVNERFLVASLKVDALTFSFGIQNTSKSIGYQFKDEDGVLIASEITADISEFVAESGIYIALNVVVPALAEFIQVRTIEAIPIWIGGSLDKPEIFGNLMSPVDGAFMEEVH